jgi:Ca2+-binding EF-hand superfamily protein
MTSKLAYYSKKVDAISYWKQYEDPEDNIYLFQIDREGSKGAKQFMIGTLDLFWDLIKSGKNWIYESWEDNPIHFAFDIDYPSGEITYSDILIHIKQIITNILIIANQLEVDINVEDIVVLENENQGTNPVNKYSFHIIFRGLVMENYIAASKFYENLTGIDLEGCDKSIYRKTCFRTCFSTKLGKNNILVPIVLDIGNKKTDNENNYDTLKDFWKSTLICNTQDYPIVYTDEIKNDDIQFEDSKTNKLIDLNNIEKILGQLPLKYSDEYFYWSKIGMILRNLNQDPEKCFEMFNTFSMKSMNKYKSKQDIIKYWKTFRDNRKNKISVGTLFLWCKEEKISFTNNKSLESIIDEYPVRKLELNQDVSYIDQRYFPIEKIGELWPNKLIGIQSEKGTGKTTTLFKYIFDQNKLLPSDSVLFISSRRTFGIKLLGDIKKFGFKLYSECKEYYIDHNRMICQLDSILRLTSDKFKYVIIDECESLMRYITSTHFTKNIKANLIVSNLESKIAEAEKVIIMDADLCDRSINYFKDILNLDQSEIKLVVNKFQPYSEYSVKYMAYSTWLKVLIDKIDNNKKIVIPTASNNQAKDLKLLIQSHYPDKKILLIHRETNENEKLDQVINVNEKWSKYDIIIYTPSVCMGISFDAEYFDHIFAYGCENSLGSQEFCQMLHRIRTPSEKAIYMTLDKYAEYDKNRHEIDINKIKDVICYDYYLTHFDLHNNLIPKKFKPNTNKDSISKMMEGSGGNIIILEEGEEKNNNQNNFISEKKFVYPYQDEPVFKVYLKNAQELISDRLNFGNQLFGYFKMKGYKLYKHEWEDGEMIKNEIKEIRELRREEELSKEIDGIYNAPDITDDQYKEIMNKRKEEMTQDDIFKLQKRNFKKCYILDDINKDILTKYKDISVMKYYHNLSVILPFDPKDTINSRLEDIRQERVNNPYLMNAYADLTIKNSYTKHRWANKIIESLGFSLLDLEIRLPVNIVEDIVDNEWIKDIDSSIEYFINKFNIAFPKNKMSEMEAGSRIKFVSKIIESQYGLHIVKDSAKNYYLSDDKRWDELYEYRTKQASVLVKLKDKIVKKDKTNINIDQSWFEE